MAERAPHAGRAESLEAQLKDAAPIGSEIEVTLMPSGALDVLMRVSGGQVIVMEGAADDSQFGLTPDLRPEDAGFHSGHPIVYDNYDDAVRALLDLLAALQ